MRLANFFLPFANMQLFFDQSCPATRPPSHLATHSTIFSPGPKTNSIAFGNCLFSFKRPTLYTCSLPSGAVDPKNSVQKFSLISFRPRSPWPGLMRKVIGGVAGGEWATPMCGRSSTFPLDSPGQSHLSKDARKINTRLKLPLIYRSLTVCCQQKIMSIFQLALDGVKLSIAIIYNEWCSAGEGIKCSFHSLLWPSENIIFRGHFYNLFSAWLCQNVALAEKQKNKGKGIKASRKISSSHFVNFAKVSTKVTIATCCCLSLWPCRISDVK